jgi:hypothetical protein
MKVPEQDIEAGLETSFWNMCQVVGNSTSEVVGKKKGSPAKNNFYNVAKNSLFVKWESLWDSFLQSRKNAWTSYWLTLPFGDHMGAGGYPGSGYSAFVYLNAPRYQLGQDLLLDPPGFPELVFNGDFALGANGWDLYGGAYYSNGAIHLNATKFSSEFSLLLEKGITFVPEALYRLQFDFSVSNSYCEVLIYNLESGDLSGEWSLPSGEGHFSEDFYFESGAEFDEFWSPLFEMSNHPSGWIDNVSIKRIS